MTTPNIVPKFNEEGRVGRPSRRFYEIHGKFVYLDSLVLSVPEGQVITQSPSESLGYPSLNHLYFNEGRVVQGENILAWKSEVDELRVIMDAMLGDGSDGLSTLSSVVSSIQALDTGEDSFIELVNKINAIEADYVTSAQIQDLSQISDLSARLSNAEDRLLALEGQDTGLLTSVNALTGEVGTLGSSIESTDSTVSALSGQVGELSTTVSTNYASLNDNITAAVGRISTLEVTTVPAISADLANLTTDFNNNLTLNQSTISGLEGSVSALSSELSTFNANRLADFATLNTNISTLSTSLTDGLNSKLDTTAFSSALSAEFPTLSPTLLADYVTSTNLTAELANKLDTASFSTQLSATFPTLSSSLLSEYTTSTDLSSALSAYPTASDVTTLLAAYPTSGSLNNILSGYTTTATLNTTLSGYATSSDLSNQVSSLSSSISNTYLPTSEFTSTLSGALTETNLSEGGSLEALGSFVTQTAQSKAEYAATTAVNSLTLDTIGTDSTTVDWSSYSFSIGSLLISDVNTFMCADPNIEFNVGQTREYLLEVPGGITWKRGDEAHDAAILWDEVNHIFHVRLAGPETYRLLTVQDYAALSADITAASSALSSELAALAESSTLTEQALSGRIDGTSAQIQEVADTLSTSVSRLEGEAVAESARLSSLIADGDASNAAAVNALATSTSLDLQNAVSALELADSGLSSDIAALSASVDSISNTLSSESSRLDAAINSSQASSETNLQAAVLTLSGADSALSDRLDNAESLISAAEDRISSEALRVDAASAEESARVDAAISALSISTSSELQQSVDTVNARVDQVEQSASLSLTSAKSALEGSITELDQRLSASISAVTDGSSQSLGEHTSAENPHGITKQAIGLANVENIGISSWSGTSNIRTLGDVTSGTWSASPISLLAEASVGPDQINSSSDEAFVFNNVAIQGQLTVSGNTVQISSTEVNIGDSVIRLNADAVGTPTEDGGFEVERGEADNVTLLWKEGEKRWSIGDEALETSGIHTPGILSVTAAGLDVDGEAVFRKKVSVPHLDITSNMSLNTASSMVALNKDARYPAYPYVGTTAGGASTEDISEVSSYAVHAYDLDSTANVDESLQLDNDSGLKVVLGGADEANAFKYAFLFWDVSESTWRLSESAPTTEETDSDNNVTRTEIVDTSSNVFDILHSGHVGASGVSAMGDTQLQVYSADLTAISGLSPNNGDFLVRSGGSWAALTPAQVKSLVTYTTDDVSEGNDNLYYTVARVRSAIEVAGDLSYDQNTGVISYTAPEVASYTSDSFSTDFTAKDTDDLTEGSANLYFTEARARSAITASGSLSYDQATGAISFTQRTDAAVAAIADTRIGLADTDDISEGQSNLYHTTARARGAISATGSLSYNSTTGTISFTERTDAEVKALAAAQITSSSTDDLSEGNSNLYFTEARARSAISLAAGSSLTYNSTTGVLDYQTPTTTDITEGDNKYFTDARARGAISATGSLSYNSTTGVLSFTERTDAGVTALANAAISASDTDAISEGLTNLYFTTERVRGAISAGSGISISNGEISATTQRTDAQVTALAEAAIAGSTTDDISEGDTNLYYTTARTRGAISADGDLSYDSATGVFSFTETGFAGKSTDDLPEGDTNQYFTAARARASFSAGSGVSISDGGAVSVNADLSSVVTRIDARTIFQKGTSWDRTVNTSGADTATSIAFGYTTDGHAGPWQVTRKLSISDGTPYMAVTYRVSSGIDQYKSLPDTNFTLTTSASGANTVHSLTLA